MAGETVITIVGNLTADPELRTIGSGATVASFTIASTPRTWNRQTNQFEDGQALFMRCSAWRDLADHCAQSLKKGMRVIATGRLQQRSYQAQDGSQRTVVEMQLDEIGPSLRYATAQVTRPVVRSGRLPGSFRWFPGWSAVQSGLWQPGWPRWLCRWPGRLQRWLSGWWRWILPAVCRSRQPVRSCGRPVE